MQIVILNGPNLNLLGKRQPEIYGNLSFEEYLVSLRKEFPNIEIIYKQSNHEGVLIDCIHQYGFSSDGIIINAGAYSHTSIAIADALESVSTKAVEVHISDIYAREKFRQHSFLKEVCQYHVIGKGINGYKIALEYFINANAAPD